MAGTGAVTLGDLAGRLDRLEARCRRCDRYGRLRLAKLIADYGADMGLPELALHLARGCPQVDTFNPAERCFVYFPQLSKLFTGSEGRDG
jgi:hypothetical protein